MMPDLTDEALPSIVVKSWAVEMYVNAECEVMHVILSSGDLESSNQKLAE